MILSNPQVLLDIHFLLALNELAQSYWRPFSSTEQDNIVEDLAVVGGEDIEVVSREVSSDGGKDMKVTIKVRQPRIALLEDSESGASGVLVLQVSPLTDLPAHHLATHGYCTHISPTHLLIHSLTYLLIYRPAHSLIISPTHLLIHSLTYLLIYRPAHSLIISPTHPPIHSLSQTDVNASYSKTSSQQNVDAVINSLNIVSTTYNGLTATAIKVPQHTCTYSYQSFCTQCIVLSCQCCLVW